MNLRKNTHSIDIFAIKILNCFHLDRCQFKQDFLRFLTRVVKDNIPYLFLIEVLICYSIVCNVFCKMKIVDNPLDKIKLKFSLMLLNYMPLAMNSLYFDCFKSDIDFQAATYVYLLLYLNLY